MGGIAFQQPLDFVRARTFPEEVEVGTSGFESLSGGGPRGTSQPVKVMVNPLLSGRLEAVGCTEIGAGQVEPRVFPSFTNSPVS